MTELLNEFLSGSAAWGVLLTLAAFALGTLINRVTGKAIFNPLLLGSIFVIILLSILKIPYADYKASALPRLTSVPTEMPAMMAAAFSFSRSHFSYSGMARLIVAGSSR